MSGSCEQLCGSFSSAKLCTAIAESDIARYLVIVISGVSAIIAFILSITQISSFPDSMGDVCNSDIIQLLSPFSITGTRSNGTQCIAHCAWPSNNTNLRFTSLSLFIITMIAMIFAMNKLRYIWLIRSMLFIILTLLFTSLVQDFGSLIAGKKVCDNDFELSYDGDQQTKILIFYCDEEVIEIDSCSMNPWTYMILSDIFSVVMCAALWQLIAYYKKSKKEVNKVSHIELHEELEDNRLDDPISNKEGRAGSNKITDKPLAFKTTY